MCINGKNMEIEKDLFKNITLTQQQKYAGISAIIFCLIANLYFMCNMLLNDDTVVVYYDMLNPYNSDKFITGLGSARWQYVHYLASWFRNPFFSGVIIVICVAIVAILFVDILHVKSNLGTMICGALIAVFPTITAFMSLWGFGYMISVLLAVLSVYICEKGRVGLAIVLCGLGLSILPINITSMLVLMIYTVIRKILCIQSIEFEDLIKDISRYILVLLGGVFIIYAGIFYAHYISEAHVELSSYQGGDGAITGMWVRNLLPNIIAAFNKTRKFHTSTMAIIPQLKFTLKISYIIQAVGVAWLFYYRRVYKHIKKAILLFLCVAILPIAVSAISVVSPEFQYSWQHRMQWGFVLCGAVVIGEMIVDSLWEKEKLTRLSKMIFIILLINMGLVVYGFAVTDNIVWSAAHYVAERDTALCTRILATLDSIREFDYTENKVYFMNFVEIANSDDTTSLLGIEPDLYNTLTADLETNLWCYGDMSIRGHIKTHEGVNLEYPNWEVIDRIQAKYDEIEKEHDNLQYGDFDVYRFEDTDTYVVVIKTQVSYGIANNR